MARIIIIGMAVILACCVMACAQDDRQSGDNLLTSSISAVFDKVGKYTSGEKRLLDPEEKGGARSPGYAEDSLGKKLDEPVAISGSLGAGKERAGEEKDKTVSQEGI